MTVREEIEKWESERLSPLASKSYESRGREKAIRPDDLRSEFQRDRDRILHSKSFRRLKFKTQVFISPEGDHYRTRLTHTLEVQQVARTIARALRLNEDLTEAIALGHDLGHTPFGHIGERTLDHLCRNGFRHYEQSLRVVDKLEKDGAGLNLTWEVRDGIAHHSGTEAPQTLEGACVARADRIAYINHDIDDALRAGILRPEDLPQSALHTLGQTHGERIETMIRDIVTESRDQPAIRMSPTVQAATDELRAFMFERVYRDSWRSREEEKCDRLLAQLFEYYTSNVGQLPLEYIEIAYLEGQERAAADFISGMTDRYAVRLYSQIFMPSAYPSALE